MVANGVHVSKRLRCLGAHETSQSVSVWQLRSAVVHMLKLRLTNEFVRAAKSKSLLTVVSRH